MLTAGSVPTQYQQIDPGTGQVPQVVGGVGAPLGNIVLPMGGLYRLVGSNGASVNTLGRATNGLGGVKANNSAPGRRYLIETDPRFVDYNNFISSDYLLDKLGVDPQWTQTRLGDGFYEQRLVLDQITQLTIAGGAKATANVERAALPAGYCEGSSVGSAFSETAGLPEGYRRAINTKTGNTEVLAADGKLYFETDSGLQPKAGGNLSGLVEAEKNIAVRQQASKITAPIDFDGHVIRAEVKSNGNVVGGHSTVTGDVRVIPGTESTPNAQGVYTAKIEVVDPANPGSYLPKTNNGGVSTMFPKS
ncbi:EndoU domain-containing protein [Xanthomonas sacchari]|uniref:EndoU domain-containing protein n=1 Tax=Xanthomonas sacchari TaxID=56458 RepID=UPI0024353E07|nr:EndoU domain-containing protein [Xanthomonas sacchari]